MAIEAKNYEIAYLLPSSVPEEEVFQHAGRIAKIIEEAGGIARHTEEPKKRRLSYEIKKQRNAYFGWISFRTAPEAMKGIEKKISAENLLRFLIVEEDASRAGAISMRASSARAPLQDPHAPREAGEPEEKLDLEALDKKLEEILGK